RRHGIHRRTSWRLHPEFVELFHLMKKGEHAARLLLVDARQGEADVDKDVLARPDLRHMLQADALEDAAEIDLAHEHVVLTVSLDHLAGDAEAHGWIFLRGARL